MTVWRFWRPTIILVNGNVDPDCNRNRRCNSLRKQATFGKWYWSQTISHAGTDLTRCAIVSSSSSMLPGYWEVLRIRNVKGDGRNSNAYVCSHYPCSRHVLKMQSSGQRCEFYKNPIKDDISCPQRSWASWNLTQELM